MNVQRPLFENDYRAMVAESPGAMTVTYMAVTAPSEQAAYAAVKDELTRTGRKDWVVRALYQVDPDEKEA